MKNTPSFLQYVECYAIILEGMTSRMSTCIYTCNTAHTYIFIIVVGITYCNFILYCACRLINVKVWDIKYGIYEFSALKGKTEYYIFQKKKKKIYRCRLIIGIINTFL